MDPCERLGTTSLRLRMAAQLFKRQLLGPRHDPTRPQTDAVFQALREQDAPLDGWLTRRSWQHWIHGRGTPRVGSLRAFDEVAQRVVRFRRPSDGCEEALPKAFFASLVRGGLLRAMVGRDHRKVTVNSIRRAAEAYAPASAWHLHVDALEAAALDIGFADVPWQVLKTIAAMRVLECLHLLWSRRWGRVYPLLPSALRLRWNAATPAERQRMRADMPMLQGRLFERGLHGGAAPDWAKVPTATDAVPEHACKTLLAIAGDPDFLVSDRLTAWAFDVATATLATGALLWSDRHVSFWGPVSDTLVVWIGLMQEVFDTPEPGRRDLFAALECCGIAASETTLARLSHLHATYGAEMQALGTSAEVVSDLANRAAETHPLRTVG
jgi:hypothetical protein